MHKSKNAKKIESKKETKRLAHRHQFEQHVAVFLWENTHGGNYPRTRAIGAQGGTVLAKGGLPDSVPPCCSRKLDSESARDVFMKPELNISA